MLAQGRMSFGALAVFSALQSTVSSGLSMALEAVPLMKSTRPIVERIQGMADSAPNPALAGRIAPTFREGIRAKNLRFSYPGGRKCCAASISRCERAKNTPLWARAAAARPR